MDELNAAIERLDKRAGDPRAIAFGLTSDLRLISQALAEVRRRLIELEERVWPEK